jgi:hypothetical protein
LRLIEYEPAPLAMADAYYGEPNTSSVLWESDLAPYKPKCDVIVVHAHAHLPANTVMGALVRWRCGLRVAQGSNTLVNKELIVCGERAWKRTVFWNLSSPAQTQQPIPIRYENAYGGHSYFEHPTPSYWGAKLTGSAPQANPPHHEVNHTNPIGKGWYHRDYYALASPSQCPAAQIESPDAPISQLGTDYAPQGLGVIGRAWQPRIALAGTYDDAWLSERHPKLPKDFNYAYWNGAHPDLQIPLIATPKASSDLLTFTLTHLVPSEHSNPQGQLSFSQLPHRGFVLARFESGEIAVLPTPIDTIIIDLQAMQLHLVHRAVAPVDSGIRVLEARFELNPQAPLITLAANVTNNVNSNSANPSTGGAA